MTDPLIGLRVQVVIDEDGTQSPPPVPQGTIVESRLDAKRNIYHVVRLDHQVKCVRAKTGQEWTLHELVVAPAFEGDSLLRLLGPSTGDPLLVSIANTIEPFEKGETLDPSRVAYFARGRVGRA